MTPASLCDSIPASGVRLVRCQRVAEALRRLESGEMGTNRQRRLVACLWKRLPLVSAILEEILDRLAEAALAVWPAWYGQSPEDTDPEGGGRREILAPWRRAAEARCRRGTAPRVDGFALATEAAQLALAVESRQLAVVLALLVPPAEPDRLLGFARAAEWIANATGAAVLVLVPAELAGRRELDSIDFEAIELAEPVPPTAVPTEEKQELLIWPLRGCPHPGSRGEQLLAARLQSDTELAGLFRFNEPVESASGRRYLVDLLWAEGRVVVEVDGYHWHSDPSAFASDRHRDFDLITSGYLPLRLPHDDVVADVDAALAKIRTLVAFRRRHPYVPGGS